MTRSDGALSRTETLGLLAAVAAFLLFAFGQAGWTLNPQHVPLPLRIAVDLGWLPLLVWLWAVLVSRRQFTWSTTLAVLAGPIVIAALFFAVLEPHGVVVRAIPGPPGLLLSTRWWLAGIGCMRTNTPHFGGWLLQRVGADVCAQWDGPCAPRPSRLVRVPRSDLAVLASDQYCAEREERDQRPLEMYLELYRLGPAGIQRVQTPGSDGSSRGAEPDFGSWERDRAIRALLPATGPAPAP